VDLEVDVCVWPNGRVKKLDEKKLKEATAEGIIAPRLARIVKEKVQGIVKDLN
jgi:predicted RNA-binding protein associated with RNAse of E/G family